MGLSPRSISKYLTVVSCLAATAVVPDALAASLTWDNSSGDNDWFNSANWNPDTLVTSADQLTVLSGSPSAASQVTVDNGGSIMLDGPSTSVTLHSLYVADTTTGQLSILNGSTLTMFNPDQPNNSDSDAVFAVDTGSVASAKIQGLGSALNGVSVFVVGLLGDATVEILDGAVVDGRIGFIGVQSNVFSIGNGHVIVKGQGSSLTLSSVLQVGLFGSGRLDILEGGYVSSNTAIIGWYPPSEGRVTVDGQGSMFAVSGSLTVGSEVTATLDISNGGQVISTNGYLGGKDKEGRGLVTVTGAGSTWTITGEFEVGYDKGTGVLKILDGGRVISNGQACVSCGDDPSEVLIDGQGSAWTHAGGLVVARNGKIELSNEGLLQIDDTFRLNRSSWFDLNGGRLIAHTVEREFAQNSQGTIFIGEFNFNAGRLAVDTFIGDLENAGGTLAAYPSSGFTTIQGGYVQGEAATLETRIAGVEPGSGYDRVSVTAGASLDGALDILLADGFVPGYFDEFEIFTTSSRTGEFSSINGAFVNGDMTLAPVYDYDGNIGLTLVAALPGDANLDGVVNGADLLVWQANLFIGDEWVQGDFNLDGLINGQDLLIWQSHLFASVPLGVGGAPVPSVPEPGAAVLLACGVLAVAGRRRGGCVDDAGLVRLAST